MEESGIPLRCINWIDLEAKRSLVDDVIRERSLDLVYQPIVDHDAGCVFGYEVLSRPLFHGRLIQPDRWFLAAHECNCAIDADLLVLSGVAKNLEAWPAEAGRPIPHFVNVMPSSLMTPGFLESLEQLLGDGHLQASDCVLEIVEYVDYAPQALLDAVRTVRSWGMQIALDDFGLGGSNPESLALLAPDFIKIDRSLIHGISMSKKGRQWLSNFASTIVGGQRVIVEGVENEADLAVVREIGIKLSQGFHWSAPLPMSQAAVLCLSGM